MRKLIFLIPALAIPASALADSPYDGPPPITWTNLYIGVHGGWAHDKAEWGDGNNGPTVTALADVPSSTSESTSSDGFLGGFQIGAQKQFGQWVAGLEADLSGSNLETETGTSFRDGDETGGEFPSSFSFETSEFKRSELEVFGTARLRLGYLIKNDLLIYGTGGVAWGKFENTAGSSYSYEFNSPEFRSRDSVVTSASGDSNHIGWTIGAGFERLIGGGWSFKGEYLYADLGEDSVRLTGKGTFRSERTGSEPISQTFQTSTVLNVEHELHILRAGLNYRF
jgi:outer membrane immunogenic protein